MSEFTRFDTSLKLEYLQNYSRNEGRDLWILLESFTFYSDKSGFDERLWIKVPKGFITDGASVPRIFWWLLPPLSQYGQAAVLHDYLRENKKSYTGLKDNIGNPKHLELVSLKQADKIFLEAMEVLKVPYWKRTLMYMAVRFFTVLRYRTLK